MKKWLVIIMAVLILTPSAGATPGLDSTNQTVCNRFEEDVSRLAAIMEEVRSRVGIKETRVAFGGVDTQIETADYWITFAAEAIAYQRSQKYTTKAGLRSSLEVLKGKVLRAKTEVRKAVND